MQTLQFAFVRLAPAEVATLQRKSFRIIAGEKAGVHRNAVDHARQAEPHDAPIMPGSASPPRFPAVHPFSTGGVFSLDKDRLRFPQQIFLGRKEIVVGGEHAPAETFGGEVGELCKILHRWPRSSTCPVGVAQNSPRSKIFTPRRKVASTIPIRLCPA